MPMTSIDLVLVDFDDTLVDTAPRFEGARQRLFDRLAALGFDRARVEHVHHHEVDPGMRRAHGLGPQRMPDAFEETYRSVCRHDGQAPDPEVEEACRRMGSVVAGTPPAISGAMEALDRLAARVPTVIYTQAGDADYQLGCLRDVGALAAVGPDRVRVVPRKTADTLRETLAGFGVRTPDRAWMVGNSIRSDVNPALEIGVRALLVEVEDPWQHDVVEPLHNGFPRVPTFRDAVAFLLGDGPGDGLRSRRP
jgi:putative hydrolase of the HAD superfamily